MTDTKRCGWCGKDPIYIDYHDNQWGRPVYDSFELFEKLCLDGQQAGLSWITVLKKQKNYQLLFDNFNPERIATYDDDKIDILMQDARIIRNRLKIQSIIKNARSYLALKEQGINFSDLLWGFVNYAPVQNFIKTDDGVPTTSDASDAMSKYLKKSGFSFVGSTICYAFMQAVGMYNDHLIDCPQHRQCLDLSK